MKHKKQITKAFYRHSESGEIFVIERRWDGTLVGSAAVPGVRVFAGL